MLYVILTLSAILNIWLLRRDFVEFWRKRWEKSEPVLDFKPHELSLEDLKESWEMGIFDPASPDRILASLARYESDGTEILAWHFTERSFFRGLRVPADTFVLTSDMSFVAGDRFRKKYQKKAAIVRVMRPMGGFKNGAYPKFTSVMSMESGELGRELGREDAIILEIANDPDPPLDEIREALKAFEPRRLNPEPQKSDESRTTIVKRNSPG